MIASGLPLFAQTSTELVETRSTLERWVETRQTISKTRSDWQADKEILQQTVALLERELKSVETQIANLSTNSAQVDKERLEAEAQRAEANECLDSARRFAIDLEGQLVKRVPQVPEPLQDILKPILAKLPADPADTRMPVTERIQVAVGILNEVDKFNNAVAIFSEKRKNPNNEEVAVETVYVGLGAAYFVNDAGDFAGTGTYRPGGWEWTTKPEIGPAVREVISIYRNEHSARFVSLPAVIQ